jgi:cell division protein FtsW
MSLFTERYDRSLLNTWWWTVDKWSICALCFLMFIGTVLIASGSQAVAIRTDLDGAHFLARHLMLLTPALVLMLTLSMLPVGLIRLAGIATMLVFLPLLLLTLVIGSEAKGASRWIYIGGFSVQPAEFLKPGFAVVNAWLLCWAKRELVMQPLLWSGGLTLFLVTVLMTQPDFGQTALLLAIYGIQFFILGPPLTMIATLGAAIAAVAGIAYATLAHVSIRINRFLDPQSGDTYQIDRALQAFATGGLTGAGPAMGSIKDTIPDAHADFIFAVAGEEFGLWLCLVIVGLFAFLTARAFMRLGDQHNQFVIIAAVGLVTQLGLQAAINMGVAVHLFPTKGITLPFVSYGGSSLLGFGLTVGLLLGLTRARPPQ